MNEIKLFNINKDKIIIDKNEVYRYMKFKENISEDIDNEIDNAICSMKNRLSLKSCYTTVPLYVKEYNITFPLTTVYSKSLSKNLSECTKAIIFAATIGYDAERLIYKYKKISPLKSLIYESVGAMLIESFCDYINNKLSYNLLCVPRFSCGYGDFDIKYQKDILKFLSAEKNCGIKLNEGYIMQPKKSVTAIIGIKSSR